MVDNCSCIIDTSAIHGGRMSRCQDDMERLCLQDVGIPGVHGWTWKVCSGRKPLLRYLHFPHPCGSDERYTPQGGT